MPSAHAILSLFMHDRFLAIRNVERRADGHVSHRDAASSTHEHTHTYTYIAGRRRPGGRPPPSTCYCRFVITRAVAEPSASETFM